MLRRIVRFFSARGSAGRSPQAGDDWRPWFRPHKLIVSTSATNPRSDIIVFPNRHDAIYGPCVTERLTLSLICLNAGHRAVCDCFAA